MYDNVVTEILHARLVVPAITPCTPVYRHINCYPIVAITAWFSFSVQLFDVKLILIDNNSNYQCNENKKMFQNYSPQTIFSSNILS